MKTTQKQKNNWQTKKLGGVCDFQNGFAFKSKLFREQGSPVLRISNIQNDGISYNRLVFFDKKDYKENFDKYKALKGDLVIAMSGATTGKLAVCNADEIFYLNQRVGKFKPKGDLSNNYLYYFLSTKIEENLKISAGSAQPNLSTEQIKNLEIPLPPLPEQHRIVKILDGVFEKIEKAKENTEKNLKNSKELFESYLQNIFANKGDDYKYNFTYSKKNQNTKTENAEWEEKRLGEVAEIIKKQNKKDLPYVGMEDIESGSARFLGVLKNRSVKSSSFYFNRDSILYGRLRPYLNKILLPDFEGHCSTEIFPILVKKDLVKEFLFYWFRNQKIVDKINKTCTGTRMPRANMKEVFEFYISYPKSLTTQKQIVAKLDKLSKHTKMMEDFHLKNLENLAELKKSLLKKAFSGEL